MVSRRTGGANTTNARTSVAPKKGAQNPLCCGLLAASTALEGITARGPAIKPQAGSIGGRKRMPHVRAFVVRQRAAALALELAAKAGAVALRAENKACSFIFSTWGYPSMQI